MPNINAARPRLDAVTRLYRRMMSHAPLRRMMARQGIDLSGSWRHGFEEMIFRALAGCAHCEFKPLCRSWLQHADRRHYPWFCPNTQTIEACRILDPKAPPLAREERKPIRGEPSIAELVEDPIIRQLMRADGVTELMHPSARK